MDLTKTTLRNLYIEKGILVGPFPFPGHTDYKMSGHAWGHLFYDCFMTVLYCLLSTQQLFSTQLKSQSLTVQLSVF